MGRIERNRQIERERAVLEHIVALLLALAGIADRACGLPAPARLRLLAILGFGEDVARAFVIAMVPAQRPTIRRRHRLTMRNGWRQVFGCWRWWWAYCWPGPGRFPECLRTKRAGATACRCRKAGRPGRASCGGESAVSGGYVVTPASGCYLEIDCAGRRDPAALAFGLSRGPDACGAAASLHRTTSAPRWVGPAASGSSHPFEACHRPTGSMSSAPR